VHHGDEATDGADADRRGEPDEGIAAETLAADHRLEQVRVRAVGELEIDRERGIEIGEGLGDDRNAVVAPGGELLEVLFGHLRLHENISGTCGVRVEATRERDQRRHQRRARACNPVPVFP